LYRSQNSTDDNITRGFLPHILSRILLPTRSQFKTRGFLTIKPNMSPFSTGTPPALTSWDGSGGRGGRSWRPASLRRRNRLYGLHTCVRLEAVLLYFSSFSPTLIRKTFSPHSQHHVRACVQRRQRRYRTASPKVDDDAPRECRLVAKAASGCGEACPPPTRPTTHYGDYLQIKLICRRCPQYVLFLL
jgi:hypothetical protein